MFFTSNIQEFLLFTIPDYKDILPFSAVCMAAGVMKLNFFKVSLYSATRILRMAIYYFMFYLGLVAA